MKEEKLLMKVHWPSITMSGLECSFVLYTFEIGLQVTSFRISSMYISSALGSPYLSN